MNKKIITSIIAAGLACVCLASCKDNNTVNTPGPSIQNQPPTATEAETHFTFVEHGQDSPTTLESADKQILYISATAERAAFVAENRIDRPSAKKMNDVLTQAYERSKDIYSSMVDEFDAYVVNENAADTSVFPWESSSDFTCLRNDSKAISVGETIESRSAGAIINTTFYAYNFDPTSGDQISQVFYVENDKASFDEADNTMHEKLTAKYGEDLISYDNVSSSFVEVAEQYWYFTEDGVHIAFGAGTIAPEEAGVLELDYTKEELPELAQKYFD